MRKLYKVTYQLDANIYAVQIESDSERALKQNFKALLNAYNEDFTKTNIISIEEIQL